MSTRSLRTAGAAWRGRATRRCGSRRCGRLRAATQKRSRARASATASSDLSREREQRPVSRPRRRRCSRTSPRCATSWPAGTCVEHDFEALAPGLRRIYREGRRRHTRVRREHARNAQDAARLAQACQEPLLHARHARWRQKARGRARRTRRAERLGEVLGEEHDLWMLSAYVESTRRIRRGRRHARELLRAIERGAQRLRERALRLGARLYRRRPAASPTRRRFHATRTWPSEPLRLLRRRAWISLRVFRVQPM